MRWWAVGGRRRPGQSPAVDKEAALERRPTDAESRRQSRRARRINERRAERERPKGGGPTPIWRSPTGLVTGAALIVGLVIVLLVVIRPGSSSSTPGGTLATPVAAIPAGLQDDRSLGRADAPVTLDIWTDFQCPFCARFDQEIEPRLVTDFVVPGMVRFVAHDLSFIGSQHDPDESTDAAVAARCAGQQGHFWDYRDYLYANQGKENSGAFTQDRLLAIANAVGLDQAAYKTCIADPTVRQAVKAETIEGTGKGINQTPTVLINGKAFASVLDYEQFTAAIRAELAAVGAASSASPAGSASSAAP